MDRSDLSFRSSRDPSGGKPYKFPESEDLSRASVPDSTGAREEELHLDDLFTNTLRKELEMHVVLFGVV